MKPKNVPLTFAMSLPNDRTARAFIDEDGKPQMLLPNQLKLPPQTMALLQATEQLVWFPTHSDAPRELSGPILNLCADYDGYSKALRAMAQWFTQDAMIFNHPTGIALIANDTLIEEISIPGLKIPKSIRICPRRPEDFKSSFTQSELRYPIRVQLTSERDNTSSVIVKYEDDWGKVTAQDWPGKWYRLVQLQKQDLQQHLRYRVCIVGRQVETMTFPFVYPPSKIFKEIAMPWQTENRAILKILGALVDRVPLDFWTAEFSSVGDDALQLEHLWVGLPQAQDETARDPSSVLWPKVAAKLHNLILDPTMWRCWQHQGSQKAN